MPYRLRCSLLVLLALCLPALLGAQQTRDSTYRVTHPHLLYQDADLLLFRIVTHDTTVPVTVPPTPEPPPATGFAVQAQCAGLTCQARLFAADLGVQRTRFRWGDGSVTNGTQLEASHTYAAGGVYTITGVLFDTSGGEHIDSVRVSVAGSEPPRDTMPPPPPVDTTPAPRPPPSGIPVGCTNAPNGWQVASLSTFPAVPPVGSRDAAGWTIRAGGAQNWSRVNGGPLGGALQVTWPKGLAGGTSPGSAQLTFPSGGLRNVYTCMRVYLDPGFTQLPGMSGVKMGFWKNSDPSPMNHVFATSAGAGAGWPRVTVQHPTSTGWTSTNYCAATHQIKGAPHVLEYRVDGGTPGVRNGELWVWLDGALVCHQTGVAWYNAQMHSGKVTQLFLEPTYGGALPGQVVPQTMTLQFAYVLVMGSTGAPTTQPPPPSSGRSHEPAGFQPFARFEGNVVPPFPRNTVTAGQGLWYAYPPGNPRLTVVQDPTAPASPPAVIETTYPAGQISGSAPVDFGGWDQRWGAGKSAVYLSMWIKVKGPDYENQASGTKVGFLAFGRDNQGQNEGLFFLHNGTGQQAVQRAMKVGFLQQGIPQPGGGTARNMFPNRAPGLMTVGVWHQWEAVFRLNTLGQANGVYQLWLDGTLVSDYRDVVYITPGQTKGFNLYKWNPTWGGSGGRKTRADYIDIDEIYLSGVP